MARVAATKPEIQPPARTDSAMQLRLPPFAVRLASATRFSASTGRIPVLLIRVDAGAFFLRDGLFDFVGHDLDPHADVAGA